MWHALYFNHAITGKQIYVATKVDLVRACWLLITIAAREWLFFRKQLISACRCKCRYVIWIRSRVLWYVGTLLRKYANSKHLKYFSVFCHWNQCYLNKIMDDVETWVGKGVEINVRDIFKALLGNLFSKSKQNDEGSENIAVVVGITSMWQAYYPLIGQASFRALCIREARYLCFRRAVYGNLSQAGQIGSTLPYNSFKIHFKIILQSRRMSADMFLVSGFPTKFSVHLLSRAFIPHISPDHPYLLTLVFREESELLSSWLCDCHNSPLIFSRKHICRTFLLNELKL